MEVCPVCHGNTVIKADPIETEVGQNTCTDTIPTWQPIETAPSCIDVLLYQDGWAINPVIVGRRHGSTWLSDCFDIDGDSQRPTHWMPLSKPPE